MKEQTELEKYYNKFNEEKRLTRRHGYVEFVTSMKYIHKYMEEYHLAGKSSTRILDIGAGTGRYSVALAEEGYDVTAVELVKSNLGQLKAKGSSVKAYQGNALKLSRFADNGFDVTLLFGPMYHLFRQEDKEKALQEAKRVTKVGGLILVAYCMNEFSILTYAFKENHAIECMKQDKLDSSFRTKTGPEDLYDYMRLEEITALNEKVGLERLQIVAADGPANYMRSVLNQMDDETYELFLQYHLATCERMELLGASAHTVDILRK